MIIVIINNMDAATIIIVTIILPGYAADDSAAVHLVDGRLLRAVRSRPGAQVYQVAQVDGEIVETALEMLDI